LNGTGERLKNLIAEMTIKPGNENISYNYFGYIFSRIRRVSDSNIPSIMGVAPRPNGTIELLFNPSYFEGTTNEVLKKVIEHEGMHVLNKHIPRLLRILSNEPIDKMKMAKARIWNTAADCAVNPVINMPRQCIIQDKPWESCFPDLYEMEDDRPTEEYYYKLLKDAKDKSKDSGEGEGEGEGEGKPGEGSPSDGHGGNGSDYDTIGDHSKWGDVEKEVADLSSLSRKIDGHIQEIIKDSVKNFSTRRGMLPGHIQSLIDKALTPPKVPYYQLIQKLIKGSRYSKFKRSLSRINRKRTYAFVIDDGTAPSISPFPGRTRDFTFKIVIMIDTSGSMDDEDVKEGLSGCKNIIEKDRHCEVTVLEVDTCLQKEYKLKRVSDIQFNVKGRGGTVLREGIERAKQINPDVLLCFTDGGCENINDFPRKSLPRKIIWVVQSDKKGGTIRTLDKTGYIVRVD
jgi:predicted metal-dependent peptidase